MSCEKPRAPDPDGYDKKINVKHTRFPWIPKTSRGFPGISWAFRTSQILPRTFLGHAARFPWGLPGFPRMSQGLPRASLGCPDVPRASPGLPGVSWASRDSQGLPRAPPGRPDIPGASQGLPGTSGRSKGFPGNPWSLRSFLRCPRGFPGPSVAFVISADFPKLPGSSCAPDVPGASPGPPGPVRTFRVSLNLPWIPWDLHSRSVSPVPPIQCRRGAVQVGLAKHVQGDRSPWMGTTFSQTNHD